MRYKHLLSEAFNLKNGSLKTKDNKTYQIVYVDPTTSENTYPYKDIFKKYNARFITTLKTWGWFVNSGDVFNKYVKPCLEELNQKSKDKLSPENVINIIDSLISEFNGGNIEQVQGIKASENDIKAKLKSFKEDLVNSYSSEEFFNKLEPIIKFNQSLGHKYSLTNTILIYIQDPKATNVKSKTTWKNFNREVKANAPVIYLWRPSTKAFTKDEKENITQQFLRKFKVNSVDELNPGQKDQLRVALSGKITDTRTFTIYAAFDVRNTEQIPGTEDLIGNRNGNVDWFEKDETETEFIETLINVVTDIIKENGIDVNYQKVDTMGGALGVSKGGAIDVVENSPNAKHTLNTLLHEFSHEILHQKYLKLKNTTDWADFFVGKSQGREAVEQQAEVAAWGVMKFFDLASNTSINYAVIWGMEDEKVAVRVFDEVAKVISKLINLITNKLNSIDNL